MEVGSRLCVTINTLWKFLQDWVWQLLLQVLEIREILYQTRSTPQACCCKCLHCVDVCSAADFHSAFSHTHWKPPKQERRVEQYLVLNFGLSRSILVGHLLKLLMGLLQTRWKLLRLQVFLHLNICVYCCEQVSTTSTCSAYYPQCSGVPVRERKDLQQ